MRGMLALLVLLLPHAAHAGHILVPTPEFKQQLDWIMNNVRAPDKFKQHGDAVMDSGRQWWSSMMKVQRKCSRSPGRSYTMG